MKRRVVISGLGVVSPIGNDVKTMWNGIKEGKCGIDKITHFDTSDYRVNLSLQVKLKIWIWKNILKSEK